MGPGGLVFSLLPEVDRGPVSLPYPLQPDLDGDWLLRYVVGPPAVRINGADGHQPPIVLPMEPREECGEWKARGEPESQVHLVLLGARGGRGMSGQASCQRKWCDVQGRC